MNNMYINKIKLSYDRHKPELSSSQEICDTWCVSYLKVPSSKYGPYVVPEIMKLTNICIRFVLMECAHQYTDIYNTHS